MGAPPALRTSAVSSATSAASSASATSAASSPRAALPGASRPRRRARPRVPPALLARVAMGLSLVHAVAHARMTDCPGCCHGFPGALSERCRAVAGAAHRFRRPRARGSARGAGARPAAHGQQRGADRPQSHRHVVHGTHLHQGARRGGRGTVVHRRRSAGARRRRHGGADAGRTELRGAPLRARRAGGVDRAVGDGIRRAAVRAGGSRAPPDPGALRFRSADRAARRGFLVPAHGRSVRRRGGVGDVRLLQRGRAAARDTRDHAVHHLDQRSAQPAVHLRAGVGNCRLGLGHQRRTAPRARPGGGAVPAQPLPPALPLAPHLASARATPAAAAAPRRADGVVPGADLLAFAIFQMMQTRLGTAGGAATQMVVMLTSLAYMPGFGIASAGTTLVGQSIGAGARGWALRVGNRVILLAALYMGGIGVLIALGGSWVLPFFTGSHDAEAAAAVALGMRLLWLAAAYQFFDGLNLGSSLCLRGAGDVRVPALLVLSLGFLLLAPLAHALTFPPGQGWVSFLPQFGLGAIGGWVAVLIYVIVLGSALFLRWRSRAWQAIRI